MLRKRLKVAPISYTIQPACDDGKSKMQVQGDNVTFNQECNTIEKVFGVTAFPTIFFVDGRGIIRKVQSGGPAEKNDTVFYGELKSAIDGLLGSL